MPGTEYKIDPLTATMTQASAKRVVEVLYFAPNAKLLEPAHIQSEIDKKKPATGGLLGAIVDYGASAYMSNQYGEGLSSAQKISTFLKGNFEKYKGLVYTELAKLGDNVTLEKIEDILKKAYEKVNNGITDPNQKKFLNDNRGGANTDGVTPAKLVDAVPNTDSKFFKQILPDEEPQKKPEQQKPQKNTPATTKKPAATGTKGKQEAPVENTPSTPEENVEEVVTANKIDIAKKKAAEEALQEKALAEAARTQKEQEDNLKAEEDKKNNIVFKILDGLGLGWVFDFIAPFLDKKNAPMEEVKPQPQMASTDTPQTGVESPLLSQTTERTSDVCPSCSGNLVPPPRYSAKVIESRMLG
ncbi:MAG TPA: hypothetical protein DIV86_01125 [Alphaproteobacteria bacterium]|nr:hypothetical protein [Alphaproteobacteria bacterium]